MTARKTAENESFDSFWASVSAGRTETIRGVEVQTPTDIPLAMEMRLKALEDSEAEDDIREMVGLLFGADVLGEWRERGMGLLEFKTVLAWGMAHAGGSKVTFREAYDIVVAAEADEGKAPSGQNRAVRRSRSASTGGRSKPTSRASTASTTTRSRA